MRATSSNSPSKASTPTTNSVVPTILQFIAIPIYSIGKHVAQVYSFVLLVATLSERFNVSLPIAHLSIKRQVAHV